MDWGRVYACARLRCLRQADCPKKGCNAPSQPGAWAALRVLCGPAPGSSGA